MSDLYFGGICFITERTISSLSVEDQVKTVLDGGIGFIQYREKELSRREIFFHAEMLRKITEEYGAVFIVNDHCDIALAVDAEGVHLGQDDLPLRDARRIMGDRIIGISTHDPAQAEEASEGGADYIGFGPVYHTTTKNAGAPRGSRMIREIRGRVKCPIVAIGGIGEGDLPEVFDAGANAVAVASALLRAADIKTDINNIVTAINRLTLKGN